MRNTSPLTRLLPSCPYPPHPFFVPSASPYRKQEKRRKSRLPHRTPRRTGGGACKQYRLGVPLPPIRSGHRCLPLSAWPPPPTPLPPSPLPPSPRPPYPNPLPSPPPLTLACKPRALISDISKAYPAEPCPCYDSVGSFPIVFVFFCFDFVLFLFCLFFRFIPVFFLYHALFMFLEGKCGD